MVWVMFGLFLSLTLSGNVWSQSHPVMHPDEVTFRKWMDDYENGPRAFIDEVIHDRLNEAQAVGAGTSMDLLGYLKYTPSQRDQVSCGDCWLWASTGVMEIALNVQNKINDRLSIQLLQSCDANQNACCGGSPNDFAGWYQGKAFMIPWSNANASFQDGNRPCDNGSSIVSCGNISTTLNYPITSIQPVIIPTQGVGQSKAISNIKNILHQNKAVYYAFWLPEDAGWPAFHDLWNNHNESSVWNPDPYSGQTFGGGHAVLIVGYNDDDPANSYWIVLNSWGTQNGLRPNGLFRLAMKINYDDYLIDKNNQKGPSLQFYTYDVTFNTQSHVTQKTNLTPYQPSGWSDKIVVSNVSGTYTDSDSLVSTDTLYVNFAVLNDSDVAINSQFYATLYVDGVEVQSWYWNSLNAHYYGYLNPDYSIGSLDPGTHYIKIVVDSTGVIDESNEGDNEYTKAITVEGNISSGADLSSEYAYLLRSCKASWSGVSCKITGNVAILNVGDVGAPATYTEVVLYNPWSGDVTLLQRIKTAKMKAYDYKNLRVSTKLPPAVGFGSGLYIVIVADADGTIDEPNWDNNFLFLGPLDPVAESYTNQKGASKDIIK
jgi:C1A family cysteine protease